jgi:biphenyl 2,3-dioxygenase beta subunit
VQQNKRVQTDVRLWRASLELQHEIEQFLYREAALLDHRKFDQWIDVLAEDIRYFMPLRTNRSRREQDLEYSNDRESAIFDDDKQMMKTRVRKLHAPGSWAEDPPSRTRHIVSNVVVEEERGKESFLVSSAFLTYRNRGERHVDILAGERQDVLRRADNPLGFEIAARTILLDQATLLAYNISFFL